MEAITERVGDSSNRRSRLPRQPTRKSFAKSPPPLPRKAQKKRKRRKETSSAEYYSVKQILAEKTKEGKLTYLIDWEDNLETGESYTPTWEPFDNVNREAIDDWIAREGQKRETKEDPRILQEHSQQPSSTIDLSPDSPPIRTAKRQRTKQSSIVPPSRLPSPKKHWRAGTVETARFQPVSRETFDSLGSPKEIKDSYEEEESLSTVGGRIRVEIPFDQTFDRDAYTKVTAASSQTSEVTHHPSQHSQPSYQPYKSSHLQLQNPVRRPFIWLEEDEDPAVSIIPDSQEFLGSLSYQPSHTATSKSGATTRPNTRTESLPAPDQSGRPFVSLPSSSLGYRHSEPPSYLSRSKNLESESETTLTGVDGSPRIPRHGGQRLSPSSPESHNLQHVGNSEPINDQIFSTSSISRRETLHAISSAERLTSLETPQPSVAHETGSQNLAHILSQAGFHQTPLSANDDSSLKFPSSLQVETQNEKSYQEGSQHVTESSYQDGETHHRRLSQAEEPKSPTVGPESLPSPSITPTQRSVPSIEATLQAAQAISPLYARQEHILEQYQNSSPRHPPSAISRRSISSTPGNLDVDTQTSSSKLPDRIPSPQEYATVEAQNRLLGCSPENILPSIEQVAEIISIPLRPSPPSPSRLQALDIYNLSPSPAISNMADQSTAGLTTAEMIKQKRAAAADNEIAQQRAARTASTIPHTPPPLVNQMLPLRETAPEAPIAHHEQILSPKVSSERELSPRHLQILPLGENVYTVPLPMVSLARDIYDQEVINHRPQRQSFLNDDEIDTKLLEDIDIMIERLKMICDHQDLIDADLGTQQLEPYHRQARWAENISTKCIFLAEFFNSLRLINMHVVVLVRPGRMMDILEALLRTNGYLYIRPDRGFSQTGQSTLRITLLPTDASKRSFVVDPASLVIAFDSTFVAEPYMELLRTAPMTTNRLAPRIHLVVTHSIEHLELCIKKNMNQLDRKAILVNSLSRTRQEVGKLDTISGKDYHTPDAAAKAVADFVGNGTPGEWPLLPMPDIDGIEIGQETTTDANSHDVQLSESLTQSYDMSSPTIVQLAFKRPLLDEDGSESSKRQRLTPVGGESGSSTNVSRINETVRETLASNSENADMEETVAKKVTHEAAQEHQISKLEIQLRSKDATEAELRQSIQRLEAKCQDYESSLLKIQPKYQEALNERGQAQHDMKKSLGRETTMREKLEARTTELTNLRKEKALADAELAVVRTALATSSIPEAAELQSLKDELNAAKLSNEHFQKKVTSTLNDMEYMRTNYQKASSAAAEMRNEVDKLKASNAILSRKASDNSVEIHRIQASSELKQHLERIRDLEAEKAETERELEKRSEELRTLLNGRRPTRGTSVPRSPRMGTMSPGQSSRPMARVLSGVGSRGNSPVPGGEGQFRGPSTFGDAFFPPMQGINRWGNHLN